MKSGVRQGDIDEPWFFNVYVNKLISRLRKSGIGCIFILHLLVVFFADDIFLLSGSILHLKILLNICFDFGVEFNLVFNTVPQSFFFNHFGLDSRDSLPVLSLGISCLQWAERIKDFRV